VRVFERGVGRFAGGRGGAGSERGVSLRRPLPWVASAIRVSRLASSLVVWLLVVVRTIDLPPSGPRNGQIKISKSNTVSIELPYDVVHHAGDNFEEDSNNCLKMIFNSDTVAVCDIETTDREVRR
jgi:hypothetical protein